MTEVVEKKPSLFHLKTFNFFVYGTIAILFTYFPIYFLGKGFSKLEIGILMSVGPFISIFSNPFWGYWSDRFQNVKRTLLMLLIGNLLVVQFVFHLDSFALLYGLMLIFFFFQSPIFSQSNSLILNCIEGTKHKFGEFRLWGSLGFAIMAVAAGPVLVLMEIRNLWIIYSALLLISIVFAYLLPKGGAPTASNGFSLKGYGQLFLNKYFSAFVLLGVLISVPNSMNNTFVSIFITDMGGSEVIIGWSAFLSAIFEIPVFLLLDRYLKKNKKIMIASLFVIALLFSLRWLLMTLVTGPLQIIFIQILHCVTFGGYYYIGTSLTALLVPSEYRASGQAAFALTWGGVSGLIAGFMGGWLFQTWGAATMYTMSTYISLSGAIGFAVIWYVLNRMDRKKAIEQITST